MNRETELLVAKKNAAFDDYRAAHQKEQASRKKLDAEAASGLAEALGGPGMSPEEAHERYGTVAAYGAHAISSNALMTAASERANAKMGGCWRVHRVSEIQQQTAADMAACDAARERLEDATQELSTYTIHQADGGENTGMPR